MVDISLNMRRLTCGTGARRNIAFMDPFALELEKVYIN